MKQLQIFLGALSASWTMLSAQELSLGPVGGVMVVEVGSDLLRVKSLQEGGPGALAGLLVGDVLRSVEGVDLAETSTNNDDGYQGAVQQYALGVEEALITDTLLDIKVLRSGVGEIALTVDLDDRGGLGVTWPASSSVRGNEIFDWSCEQIHAAVQASSSGDFGYNTGWFGMILLAHPDWNATSGAKPYRNSINLLRTRCVNLLNRSILEPEERFFYDGSDVVANPNHQSSGLENWDICSSVIFLATYRMKTGDTSVDEDLDHAAKVIGHRVQTWIQYDDPGLPHVLGGILGRMGHGGVVGDYSHYNGIGALNIVNAHALVAMGLLKQAGVDMSVNLGLSTNSKSYDTAQLSPTLEEKFKYCWSCMKQATNISSGGDNGNVGYAGVQSGWDSTGRTSGAVAGWSLYGLSGTTDDNSKLVQQKAFVSRRWYRQQHCHAYTLGGVVLSQLSMPFLSDRQERYFQENSRMYAALMTQPNGSAVYVPGRGNNAGDGYLNYTQVSWINAAMPMAIASGNLPGFPARSSERIFAWMKSPANHWPVIESRKIYSLSGLSHSLDLEIQDAMGSALTSAGYTASWSKVAGPGAVTFSNADGASVDVQFGQVGDYQLQLSVTRNGYTLVERYEVTVTSGGGGSGVAPFILNQPQDVSVELGGNVTLSLHAQGTETLVYEWKKDGVRVSGPSSQDDLVINNVSAGDAGNYQCVVTNAFGAATSEEASVLIEGVGEFIPGGLWQDIFYGADGTLPSLTSLASYPLTPDASGVLEIAEATSNFANNYGQRWSGWITAPEDGNYQFYIATDDAGELWLSTDATRANRVKIAEIKGGYATPRQWNKFSSQASPQIALLAGKKYYIEVLQSDGGGGDNCAITWNWQSAGTWSAPDNGSAPLPGALLEYQVGGTISDTVTPPPSYPPTATEKEVIVYSGAETVVELTGTDLENDSLTFEVLETPKKGSLTGTEPSLVYIPFTGQSGVDRFTFRAYDGTSYSEPATVTVILVAEATTDLLVWQGSTDDSWSVASNWMANRTPVSSDVVVFDARSMANFNTRLVANMSVKRLLIGDASTPIGITGSSIALAQGIEMGAAAVDLSVDSSLSLSSAQSWNVAAERELTVGGNISGSVALRKTGPGTLRLTSADDFTGPLTVSEGVLDLAGGGWYGGYIGGRGLLTVENGAVANNRVSHAFGSFSDTGRDLVIKSGSRFQLEKETYIDDITLTGATLANYPAAISEVRSANTGSLITVLADANSSEISCHYRCAGAATFLVNDGLAATDLLFDGVLAGSAIFEKQGTGRMVMNAANSHTGLVRIKAGEVVVNGSLMVSDEICEVQMGGRLSGNGTVNRAVEQGGTISPGFDGFAILEVSSLSQQSTARTLIEIGGPTLGAQYDRLAVNGAATLAGTLQVNLVGNYVPLAGASFEFLTFASATGAFATTSLPTLPADREWRVETTASGMTLHVDALMTPFQSWQLAKFGVNANNPLIAGPMSDPDNDGQSNLIEYALGRNPNVMSDGGGLLNLVATGSDLVITYRRAVEATDVTFEVVESDDLDQTDAWVPATLARHVQTGTEEVWQLWEAVPTDLTGSRRFYALKVTLNP